MRKIQLLNRVLLCVVVCSLAVMYLAAFASYTKYGQWPSYNSPESWSSYPLDTLPWSGVLITVLMALVFMIFPLGALVAVVGAIGSLFLTKEERLRGFVESTALLVAIAGVYLDPFGIMNWFMD